MLPVWPRRLHLSPMNIRLGAVGILAPTSSSSPTSRGYTVASSSRTSIGDRIVFSGPVHTTTPVARMPRSVLAMRSDVTDGVIKSGADAASRQGASFDKICYPGS
jgi:hypothetical protein